MKNLFFFANFKGIQKALSEAQKPLTLHKLWKEEKNNLVEFRTAYTAIKCIYIFFFFLYVQKLRYKRYGPNSGLYRNVSNVINDTFG